MLALFAGGVRALFSATVVRTAKSYQVRSRILRRRNLVLDGMDDASQDWTCSPASFEARQWLLLARLFQPETAQRLIDELLSTPPRRVTVGEGGDWWNEYSTPDGGALRDLLTSPPVVKAIEAIWGRRVSYVTRQWGQVYEIGERIPWHVDGQGDIQLVLCLEAPPPECGGALKLRTTCGEVEHTLRPGDALLFRATDVAHSTARIVAAGPISKPRRIVAVCRFFIEGVNLPVR